jgi:HSP20 family protein
MSSVQKRSERPEQSSALGRLDRLFDEWMRSFAMRRPFGMSWEPGDELIRVDEYRDGDTQVIRAEVPGIDPARDVELTVQDGMLTIRAERRVEEQTEDKGYTRHELRYGSMTRTLPLPDRADPADIRATYKDGLLEIRVPVPAVSTGGEPTRIDVTTG